MEEFELRCRRAFWGGVLMVDGGRVAAYGFQYQYLRTIEHLVGLVGQSECEGVRVEGAPSDRTTTDKVDFDVVGRDGDICLVAQVKSKVPGGTLGGVSALGVLLEMVKGENEAPKYSLLTNGRPDKKSSRLREILTASSDEQDLRERLEGMCHDAPQRRAQVAELDELELARLMRCDVQYDSRDDLEIRENLRNALRGMRNAAHLGLGERSAGLLVGYLISEIFSRAADLSGEKAEFSIAELRRLALVDGETLSLTVGSLDWGVVVGPIPRIPDVRRPQIVNQIVESFPRSTNRITRSITLSGPSGIGKSSSAALYVADRADQYDVIAWVNCETTSSLHSDFRRALLALAPSDRRTSSYASPEDLQREIQLVFGRFPGRYLFVLDNVTSMREVHPWIPKASRGDVIITTIDSAAIPAGGSHVVAVSIMERQQSVELLRRRLQLTDDEAVLWDASLQRMAAELGDWPLALELGAGYLFGCGYGIESAHIYLDALRARGLSDRDSIPVGYPQTLAAALNMCIDRLEERIEDDSSTGPDAAAVACHLLSMSAFLGAHQIPAHLVLATILASPEDEKQYLGPLIVSPEVVRLGEVLRELLRFSLVKNDLPLPDQVDGTDFPEATRTIAVNSITQEIIRMRVSKNPDLATAIDRLVGHVERWLRASTEFGMVERVRVIQSHAEALLVHTESMGVSSVKVALLCGNLASPYNVLGDLARAEQLLMRELEILQDVAPGNETLISQTRFMLAQMYILLNHNSQRLGSSEMETTHDDAVRHLEYVLRVARSWVEDYPNAALKFAADARATLRGPGVELAGFGDFDALAEAFADLESRLPESEYSRDLGLIEKSEECLGQGRFDLSEQYCREVLRSDPTGWVNAEARRLLVEALARQGEWNEALKEVRFWKVDPTGPRLFRESIVQMIRNVGQACAEAYLNEDFRSVPMMYELVDWPDLESFTHLGSDEAREVIRLLRACCEIMESSPR